MKTKFLTLAFISLFGLGLTQAQEVNKVKQEVNKETQTAKHEAHKKAKTVQHEARGEKKEAHKAMKEAKGAKEYKNAM